MNRAGVAQIFSREESFRRNAIQEIHWEKGKTVGKCFERESAVTWYVSA